MPSVNEVCYVQPGDTNSLRVTYFGAAGIGQSDSELPVRSFDHFLCVRPTFIPLFFIEGAFGVEPFGEELRQKVRTEPDERGGPDELTPLSSSGKDLACALMTLSPDATAKRSSEFQMCWPP